MPPRTQSDRIAALEEGYRNIGREVGGLREDFAQFARDVRGELHSRDKVQWSPLIASIGVAVAIIGGLVTLGAQGPMRDLERHDVELRELHRMARGVETTRFTNEDGRRVWEAIAELRDEDFDRNEAERMLADLLARVDLRDESLRREFYALLGRPIRPEK